MGDNIEGENSKMKLYALYTKTHKVLKDEWFMPSLPDGFDLNLFASNVCGGEYLSENFKLAILAKTDFIIEAIKENLGNIFVYSDVDMQFFEPVSQELKRLVQNRDIVCQKDGPGPDAPLCTGFFVMHASKKNLVLWKLLKKVVEKEKRDQTGFNRLIKKKGKYASTKFFFTRFDYQYLPIKYFGGGTLSGRYWNPGDDLVVPENIVLHHANYTSGVENKIAQLKYVRNVVNKRHNFSSE